MTTDLTKEQYKEVESLITRKLDDIKMVVDKNNKQIGILKNEIVKVEKSIIGLQFKTGVFASMSGAITSFLTYYGINFSSR